MYQRYVISDQERGLLVRNGQLIRWLEPGRHRVFRGLSRLELRLFNRDTLQTPFTPELMAVAPSGAAVEAFVPETHLGLLRADGVPKAVLQPGRYLLWQLASKVTLDVVSLEPLRPSIPEGFWALVPTAQVQTVLVLPFERALVHVDGVLREVLTKGRAAYSTLNRKLEVMRMDLREQEVQILGQELMTRDKVTLRLNLIVKFRVTDPVKANPLLSLNYPESRTEVIEFFLREGVRDVIQHVLAWNRIQSPREQSGDMATMSTSLFWNTLLTEVRGGRPTTPASWRELEWTPRAERVKKPASSKIPGPAGTTSPPARKPRKPRQS